MALTNFQSIDPTRLSLKYIDLRVNSPHYRGEISSQHNRYTIDEVVEICKILNKYAPPGTLMKIRNVDLSKRPTTPPDEEVYAHFINEVKTTIGKGTQDSVRKNYFPDFDRGTLIRRYDNEKQLLDPWQGSGGRYVELTEFGKEFINANIEGKQIAFTKYIDKLLGGYVSILNSILLHDDFEDFGKDKIFFEEFQFFISALNAPHPDFKIDQLSDCINLMRDFRKLPMSQRRGLSIMMSEQLKPENFTGDKTMKRDLHNWNNKIQQMFYLLNQTPYFEVATNNQFIAFKTSIRPDEFDAKKNRKRNLREKIEYRKKHTQNLKVDGFELDHLIPFSWAETAVQNSLIDHHKNMLYIDGYSHGIKTQNRSKHHILEPFNELDFLLKSSDPEDEAIYLEFDKNVKYNPQYRDEILEYNKQLCEIV